MNKSQTLLRIKEAQRRWADAHNVNRDGDSVLLLENNLYQPLTPETRAQYESGDGNELGQNGKRGKMFALRSSSALVCNVFDYWQGRALTPILKALQITEEANEIALEQKFKTGLGGNPPNLDVVFRRKDTNGHVTAIESKFAEPYDDREHKGFASSYFEKRGLWDGLPLCRGLADLINGGEQFTCLDAPQLLKHILGLCRNHKQHGFTLLYLWYDVGGSDAAESHRKEIQKFQQIVSREVSFRSMTHQEVFARLFPHIKGTNYAEYLSSRYFSMPTSPIVGFYCDTEPDHRGRYLHDIQQWADDKLEAIHDYIQWLFPLPEASGFNLAAPILNRESIQEFRARPDLQDKLRVSFLRMMNFYGFEARSGEQITVNRAPNFASKATVWLSPGNHNHLRITRILRCLSLLGLEGEAKAFFDCLSQIYEDEQNEPLPAISDETMLYWRGAVGDAGSG